MTACRDSIRGLYAASWTLYDTDSRLVSARKETILSWKTGGIPSAPYLAFSLEDSNLVECLLLDQRICGNGACWASTNHGDSSDLWCRHLSGLQTKVRSLVTSKRAE